MAAQTVLILISKRRLSSVLTLSNVIPRLGKPFWKDRIDSTGFSNIFYFYLDELTLIISFELIIAVIQWNDDVAVTVYRL